VIYGALPGADAQVLVETAIESGLRQGEPAELRAGGLDLASQPPTSSQGGEWLLAYQLGRRSACAALPLQQRCGHGVGPGWTADWRGVASEREQSRGHRRTWRDRSPHRRLMMTSQSRAWKQ
jgi:hypothetical protein